MPVSGVQSAVQIAVERTDASFLERARPLQLTDGTTAVWALLFRQHLLVGHLGDSRALLCRRALPSAPTSLHTTPHRRVRASYHGVVVFPFFSLSIGFYFLSSFLNVTESRC